MGLDMYLYAKHYVAKYDDSKHDIVLDGTVEIEGVNAEKVKYVLEEVGYWRKANAIHRWFVETYGHGIDECQPIRVPREGLETLRLIVGKIIEEPELAPRLLPSQDGFFFGSTSYDEGYLDDLKRTAEILDRVLKSARLEEFEYQASW